jgi:hypothetical protein
VKNRKKMEEMMKKRTNCLPVFLLAAAPLAGLIVSGCGPSTSSTSVGPVESFVAVTSSAWDAEVTFGTKNYKMALALQSDKSFSLAGTYSSEAKSQGGGGFGPGGGTTTSSTDTSTSVTPGDPFSISGSWSLEEGYGYVLTFNDSASGAAGTVVHTDYNKSEGRHEFYYIVNAVANGASLGSATVFFQAKDAAFRKTLAADYQSWDIRGSSYVFSGYATGNNSSLATENIYLYKDGSVKVAIPNGSSMNVTIGGTWSEVKASHALSITIAGKSAKASYCDTASKEGYRLIYTNTCYCSLNSAFAWTNYTAEDFDGKTLYAFTGKVSIASFFGSTDYKVSLNCTSKGSALIYVNDSPSASGVYTFANEVFTITMDGKDPVNVAKGNDGKYSFATKVTIAVQMGPMSSSSDYDVTLIYTPGA